MIEIYFSPVTLTYRSLLLIVSEKSVHGCRGANTLKKWIFSNRANLYFCSLHMNYFSVIKPFKIILLVTKHSNWENRLCVAGERFSFERARCWLLDFINWLKTDQVAGISPASIIASWMISSLTPIYLTYIIRSFPKAIAVFMFLLVICSDILQFNYQEFSLKEWIPESNVLCYEK